MKTTTRSLLACFALSAAFAVVSGQEASAQTTKPTIQISNKSTALLECRASWNDGALTSNFNLVRAGTNSEKKSVPLSDSSAKTISCNKRGDTATQSTPLQFQTAKVGNYVVTCVHSDETAKTGLTCSLTEAPSLARPTGAASQPRPAERAAPATARSHAPSLRL